MNKHQLRDLITRVLKSIEGDIPFSTIAVEALLMIAAHESKLGHYIRQVKGPAKGIFQIEPATEDDIWLNYLMFRPEKHAMVSRYMITCTTADTSDLEFNLVYQILLARVMLYRVPEALPEGEQKLARYLKKHWNTQAGKAKWTDYWYAYTKLAK